MCLSLLPLQWTNNNNNNNNNKTETFKPLVWIDFLGYKVVNISNVKKIYLLK